MTEGTATAASEQLGSLFEGQVDSFLSAVFALRTEPRVMPESPIIHQLTCLAA